MQNVPIAANRISPNYTTTEEMTKTVRIKYDWRAPVAKIFREFESSPWSAEIVRNLTGIENLQGIIAHLHYVGVIKPALGTKRCQTRKMFNGTKHIGTEWVFTQAFVNFMKNGGADTFEKCIR